VFYSQRRQVENNLHLRYHKFSLIRVWGELQAGGTELYIMSKSYEVFSPSLKWIESVLSALPTTLKKLSVLDWTKRRLHASRANHRPQ